MGYRWKVNFKIIIRLALTFNKLQVILCESIFCISLILNWTISVVAFWFACLCTKSNLILKIKSQGTRFLQSRIVSLLCSSFNRKKLSFQNQKLHHSWKNPYQKREVTHSKINIMAYQDLTSRRKRWTRMMCQLKSLIVKIKKRRKRN